MRKAINKPLDYACLICGKKFETFSGFKHHSNYGHRYHVTNKRCSSCGMYLIENQNKLVCPFTNCFSNNQQKPLITINITKKEKR